MGQALYRKYRSKSLAEIVGQEHITRALSRALEQDKLSHAYLFTGPRGTGKTSIARILAFEANKMPYDETATHLDIIEIDAASNRRIDEIRDLREKVHIAPTSAKYKVYIIDEVHMLTREAFNALLKTLEEPPAHVIFVLATTEMHKLPETIISRTQHYAFKPIDLGKVTGHLAEIAQTEKIKIDTDALQLIAAHGEGSFRDSISLLDQVRHYADEITLQDVQAVLGIAPDAAVTALLDHISAHDAGQTVQLLTELRNQGIEPSMLAKQLGHILRGQLLENSAPFDYATTLELLHKLVEVPAATDSFTALELCLLDVVFAGAPTPTPAPKSQRPVEKPKVSSTPQTPHKPTPQPKTTKPEPTLNEQPMPLPTATDASFDPEKWPAVLSHLKTKYNTMYGVLRMANPVFEHNTVTLLFKFPFHQKRVNDPKNKKIISDAIIAVTGASVELICSVADNEAVPTTHAPAAPVTKQSDVPGSISNIFGGGELLES